MTKALSDWPIAFREKPSKDHDKPKVSFIIGHRGTERLPHLLMTLQSLAAQEDIDYECVVVEQSEGSSLKDFLPDWVRYVHTPVSESDMPFCRSWAFNVGARMSHGDLLVLHDNDMLVPKAYAKQLFDIYKKGYEVINLKRFVFYLSQHHSAEILARKTLSLDSPPEVIVQNLEAGGSIGIGRASYYAIGGFDESFVGWGGEDNEFWERATTKPSWTFAYMPVVHIWHPSQPGKLDRDHPNTKYFETLSMVPPGVRIQQLVNLNFSD